jgi:hypothetical protein
MALINTITKQASPTSPQTKLMLCFTVASITIATRKTVAISFHIRNFCEEYLNTPASAAYKLYVSKNDIRTATKQSQVLPATISLPL